MRRQEILKDLYIVTLYSKYSRALNFFFILIVLFCQLMAVPRNGLLLVKGDLNTNAVRYLMECEGARYAFSKVLYMLASVSEMH